MVTERASNSPELPALQPSSTDEDGSTASNDAGGSDERKFEQLPMPELGRDDYVLDNVFYCPWSEWYPDGDEGCYDHFLSARDRQ